MFDKSPALKEAQSIIATARRSPEIRALREEIRHERQITSMGCYVVGSEIGIFYFGEPVEVVGIETLMYPDQDNDI